MKWLEAASGGKLKDYLDQNNHAPDFVPAHGKHVLIFFGQNKIVL
jgi:hypothetical protein